MKVQSQATAESVRGTEVLGRPVRTEGSVVAARDARDVAQAGGLAVRGSGERPRPALGPPRDTESSGPHRAGHPPQVVTPRLERSAALTATFADARSIGTDEPQ